MTARVWQGLVLSSQKKRPRLIVLRPFSFLPNLGARLPRRNLAERPSFVYGSPMN